MKHWAKTNGALRRTFRIATKILLVAVAALLICAIAYAQGLPIWPTLAIIGLGQVSVAGLREQKVKLIADARVLVDKVEAEAREMTAEERAQFDKMTDDATKAGEDADRRERLEQHEADLARSAGTRADPDPPGGGSADPPERRVAELAANPAYLRFHQQYGAPDYRQRFNRWLMGGTAALGGEEARALQADLDVSGGYLVAPEEFARELIKAVDNLLFFRQLARVFPVLSGDSLGAPSLDADPEDADWTGEVTTADEDTAMKFGRRHLKPNYLSKLLKVSNPLMRRSALPIEQLISDRLAYKIAVPQENAYLNGTGAGQPLGVFVASANGISTGRDVATGNAATYPTYGGLVEAKYTLKGQYWANANWIFHRDVVKALVKLQDGEGRYIWLPSITDNTPDRLLGFPVRMSEYAPNTMTASLYVGILGDFRAGYWIVDSLMMQIQRLVELYAANNQTGFIVRAESDGMPVLEEAFVRVKLGA